MSKNLETGVFWTGIVPLEEVSDTEPVPAQGSPAAILSPTSNIPPEPGSKRAINDDRSDVHPKIRTLTSHRTIASFIVKIDGWEFPRWIYCDDGFVYFQVSNCYPCSVCEYRITSLHVAIRKYNHSQVENSEIKGGDDLQRNASYSIMEGEDREAFFVFQYTGSKTPQDIAKYLSARLGLHITVKQG